MLDCSQKGGIVLDPFGGSGSTMIAAQKTGRRASLIELDAYYVDCAVRRWKVFTKDEAVNAVTGETFDERESRLRTARLNPPSTDPALSSGLSTKEARDGALRLHVDDPSRTILRRTRTRHLNLPAIADKDYVFDLSPRALQTLGCRRTATR